MRKIYLILPILLFTLNAQAQHIFSPIDTIETDKGTVLLYPDRSWEYMEDIDFDGVMNPQLHYVMSEDSTYMFKQYWDNDKVMTYTSNPVEKMKDTVWMCVIDSLHHNYCIPFDGRVTSHYGIRHGRYHNGTDIDLETGDTVYAAFDGKVRYSDYNKGGYGNLVVVRHFNGLETYYAHLSDLLVAPNQEIKAGDPIGLGGNTGHSTGSHLHFEVRFYDEPMDPEIIFDFKKKKIKDENLLVHSQVFSHSKSSSSSSYMYSGEKKYYKIKSGDTLGAIAIRNKTSVSRLCQLNGIKPTTVLQIGQTIRVR